MKMTSLKAESCTKLKEPTSIINKHTNFPPLSGSVEGSFPHKISYNLDEETKLMSKNN